VLLSELTASARRLALVGLAKNTGKTVALGALLRELEAAGRHVGVTSVGRDGEERDVIDFRIEKPRIEMPGGSLVATTDGLLRASGLSHELLEETNVRTPLGRVLVARLRGSGAIEIAGPSAAADVRAVADAMLAHGAEQVLIDGAVDRRAASSPDVADQLVISTGAVLDADLDEVVLQTRDAVDLVRLPQVAEDQPDGPLLRALAGAAHDGISLIVDDRGEARELPPRFVLSAGGAEIGELLDANPTAHALIVSGALPDRFLRDLLLTATRRRRELIVVAADPTRVFLSKRGPAWYRRQGIRIQVLSSIALAAVTVNPVAPGSHRFDSAQLRSLIEQALPGIAVFDVLDPSYPAAELLAH
jgi:hypothetical protein